MTIQYGACLLPLQPWTTQQGMFQATVVNQLVISSTLSALFFAVMQRTLAITLPTFGTTYRSHLQGYLGYSGP
jgi:hypothetical protein